MKKVLTDQRVPIKIWTDDIEPQAEQQLRNVAKLPFVYSHIAVMPDVHAGVGSTIGSVVATENAVVPAMVGVDLGCGMSAVKLPISVEAFLEKDFTLKEIRSNIEKRIPVGKNSNPKIENSAGLKMAQLGSWKSEVSNKLAGVQIGTLGGGNHYVEICKDEENSAWIVLHSGSRNIGNALARYHIEKAKGLMKEYFITLPDPDLAYFAQSMPEFQAYVDDLMWAQRYAKANRLEMMERTLGVLVKHFDVNKSPQQLMKGMIDCHHNYTEKENHYGKNLWVTRKGAVKATHGTLGIIPGSMGAKSFIVEGKGEPMSFCSCSHGAGRKMSRSKAKENFTVEDLIQQTDGVECRKDSGVLDEIPGAYKNIDEVMANQVDLVDIKHTLKQIMCIKG